MTHSMDGAARRREEGAGYFSPPFRCVESPKSGGGSSPLVIATVADRVASVVVKQVLKPALAPIFDQDSYGYRPGKLLYLAADSCRKRCWTYDWVVDLYINGVFGWRAPRKSTFTPRRCRCGPGLAKGFMDLLCEERDFRGAQDRFCSVHAGSAGSSV